MARPLDDGPVFVQSTSIGTSWLAIHGGALVEVYWGFVGGRGRCGGRPPLLTRLNGLKAVPLWGKGARRGPNI
jgi:hypothetical protein